MEVAMGESERNGDQGHKRRKKRHCRTVDDSVQSMISLDLYLGSEKLKITTLGIEPLEYLSNLRFLK